MDQQEGKNTPAIGFDVEEEEALSLSDLPVSTSDEDHKLIKDKNEDSNKLPENEEFEFRTWGSSGLCDADEIFFNGRILPLRQSISSDTCVFAPSRSSSSSSRSSSCISRSHSSSSSSTGGQILVAPRAHAISNNFYAHPSPSPQLRRANAGRRSTGSAPVGWSVFRLGLVQAPEIEMHNLRARRVGSVESSSTSTVGSRSFRELCFSSVVKRKNAVNDHQNNGKVVEEEKKAPLKFFGLGFACKCSPDSVEKHEQKMMMMMMKKKKKKKSSSEEKRGESVRQRRIFEWLEELTVARMMV